MNHIKRLQRDLKAQTARSEALEEGIRAIMGYMQNPKFYNEPYVNVDDITLRCREALDSGTFHENLVIQAWDSDGA